MKLSPRSNLPIPPRHLPLRQIVHGPADIYVGRQFRLWLTGFRTGDLFLWERAFATSASAFGVAAARDICRDMSQWVRILSERSRRNLKVLEPDDPCFGRDECIVMALVAAHQHKACPALQACAMTLLACENCADTRQSSMAVAERLAEADQVLSPSAMNHLVRYTQQSQLI